MSTSPFRRILWLIWTSTLSLFCVAVGHGVEAAEEKVNLDIVHRIKAEAFENSKVMDYLFRLTDVNGPRLTGSPGFQRAADWAMDQMKANGVERVRLEPWTGFGRSWTFSRFSIQLNQPVFAPMHGVPMAWCAGTKGVVQG